MENKTLRDYLRIIFRHKAVIVISTVAVLVATYIKIQIATPYYTATVNMLVSAERITESEYYRGIGMGRYTGNHVELIKSQSVLNRVVEALKLYQRPLDVNEKRLASSLKKHLIDQSIKSIQDQINEMNQVERGNFLFGYALQKLDESFEAALLEKSSIFTITVRDYNPEMAVAIANSLSRSYIIFDLEQQINDLQLQYGDKNVTVVRLNNYVEQLHETLDGKLLPKTEVIGLPTMRVMSQAQFPTLNEPVNKKQTLAFALIGGIVLGLVLAVSIDLLDQTFKSPQEIESILNIPFLGAIPKNKVKKNLLISQSSSDPTVYSQSYKNISDQMSLLITHKKIKTFLLVDTEEADDAAGIIVNLGITMANNQENKVLIIDANLRSPYVSKKFNLDKSVGLTDIFAKKISFMEAVTSVEPNLHVLSFGKTKLNPIILLESTMLSDLIEDARKPYNIILISCADAKNYTDSVILASKVDAVIFIINEGKVRRQVVKGVMAPFEQKKANIAGAILNNRTYSLPGLIYRIT